MVFSFGHSSCFKLASNVSRVCEVAENGKEYFSLHNTTKNPPTKNKIPTNYQ